MPERAVEPRRLYGPRVAALRNQATRHTGAAPGNGTLVDLRPGAPADKSVPLADEDVQEIVETAA